MSDKEILSKTGKERLQCELDKLMNDPDINNCFGVDYFDPDADNPDVFHWQITLIPPIGSNYEGGFFKIEAKFRESYPNTAPIMKFLTRIYHSNVCSETGHICVNSIKSNWSKKLTMEDVLNHIIVLLYKQEPGDAFNSTAASSYTQDKNKFLEEVKKQIKEYANINDFENLSKQNIKPIKDCNCYWCGKIFNSIN